ncbi:MAG: hypothetical protein WC375_09700 [Methanomassiliicoccales archaeon]|jgi:hypothetical protein
MADQVKSPDILDEILSDDVKKVETSTTATLAPKSVKIEKKNEVKEVKEIKEDQFKTGTQKFIPGVGVDIGTSNIVVSRCTKDGVFVSRFHRNMLYPLEISDEANDLLQRGDYLYVKVSDKYYIVGEDALKLVNAIGRGEVVRPMKDGILNPSLKESTELLFYIIKAVVGDPIVPNEALRFSLPANPVDLPVNNLFHQMTLQSFFTKMGYTSKPINEAMCICYDCNPVMKGVNDEAGEEEDVALSGIVCSCGAGMTNIAMSYKGLELATFSITKSGDYIDEQASAVTGTSVAKIIRKKEKRLDLANIDGADRDLVALGVYYDEFLDRVLHNMAKYFTDKKSNIEGKIEIVVAGGTSMPHGFCDKFSDVLKKKSLPFSIYRVRHSTTPFYSVVQGACLRAQADQAKV